MSFENHTRQGPPRKMALLRPSSAPGTKARISPSGPGLHAYGPGMRQGWNGRRKPRPAGHVATTKPTPAKHRDKGRARDMCAGYVRDTPRAYTREARKRAIFRALKPRKKAGK